MTLQARGKAKQFFGDHDPAGSSVFPGRQLLTVDPSLSLIAALLRLGQCEHTPSSLYGSIFPASLTFIVHLKASLIFPKIL